MQKFFNSLTNSDFFKQSCTLVAGTGFSMFIQVLSSPVLSRIYSPVDFGIFALFFSIVTFSSVIISARYELAIILPEKDSDSAYLVLISIVASFIIGLLLLAFLAVLIFTNVLKYDTWLYYIPLTCLFLGIFQVGYYWLIRCKRFRILAYIRILQASSIMLLSIFFAFVFSGFWGLVFGYIIGQIIAGLCVFIIIFRDVKVYWRHANGEIIFALMKRYKNFPLYSNLSGIIENLAVHIPTFLLAAFFGKGILGFYTLAQRVTSVPMRTIAAAIGDVFRQKASSLYIAQGECADIFMRVFLGLLVIAILPFVIFFLTAPYLFAFVFGDAWMVAGEYARILTVMLFLQFVIAPLTNMFVVAEKQRLDFFANVFLVIGVMLSFGCGYYYFNSAKISLLLFTIVYSIKYLFQLVASYRFSLGAK